MFRALSPQHLLVPQRGHARRLSEAPGQGPLADAAVGRQFRQRERKREPGLDLVLRQVGQVAEVVPVPEHGAGLRFVAVAARVHHHFPRYPGRHGGAVTDGDQVQREIDAAGDARRRGDPPLGHVQDVADDSCGRALAREFVLELVMGGASPAVEEPGPAKGERPGADADDGAARVVVSGKPGEAGF